MKLKLLLLACITVAVFSCKQHDNDVTPSNPPATGKTVQAILRLSGDISVSESPLGRKVNGTGANARELKDSTIYYVIVRKDNISIYSGIFNHADSIRLTLPADGNIMVEAAIYKRGSGPGLYYSVYDGLQNFVKSRLYNNFDTEGFLLNRMDTLSLYSAGDYRADGLEYLTVFSENGSYMWNKQAELDTYYGQVSFAGSSAPAVVNLPVKRCTFGIQFSADNFTAGRLYADFAGKMAPKYITPGETATPFLYTAKEFLQRDSLVNDAVTVYLQWEKPNGDILPLGQKTINFKRNILTQLHVSLPTSSNGSFTPVITETTWSGTETVGF